MFIAGMAVLGLLVGSYLANVVYRLHAKKQYVKGRSQCPHCGHELSALDLIPVLSWLFLRGRCRYCKKPISVEYPLIELLTAVLFGLSYLVLTPQGALEIINFVVWLYVLSSFVVLAVYDLKWYLLPDKVLLPLIVPIFGLQLLNSVVEGNFRTLVDAILAATLFGGFFYLLALVSKGKWMGGGDIKLSFVMGLLLGLQKTALAMFLAFNSAAIVGVGLIVAKGIRKNALIPFGPFLIGGTIIAYLYGTPIIEWYVRISGLNLIL